MPSTVVLHLKPRRLPMPGTAASPGRATDAHVDSDALLQGRREVLIRHSGETYRLRHTRNGKLILTK